MTTPYPPVGPALPHDPMSVIGGPSQVKNPGLPKRPTPPKPPVVKKPPTKPKPLSPLAKWLAGDTTYQQQLNELNAERSAYQQNKTRQDQITNRDFANTQRQMNQQATTDRRDQQYDFAGRGILHSGVYAQALGNYNTDFQNKLNNLIQGKTDTLANSQADLNDFLRQITLQQNAAKQDAIRRRQASLGIS